MGKKPAAKGKAKAAAAAPAAAAEPEMSAEQLEAKKLWLQRREATKWAQAKLEIVRDQYAAAKKGKIDWLEVAHEFHEIRLIKVVKRLDEKRIDAIPQETREAVDSYVTQCAEGPVEDKEGFRQERGIWEFLEEQGYKRGEESPEALAAIDKLKEWEVASSKDAVGLVALLAEHLASPGAQEAGMVRIGGLLGLAQKAGGAAAEGLDCHTLFPAISAGMRAHMQDPSVLRAGFAALRGVAMAHDQMHYLRDAGGIQLAVEALHAQYKDKEACGAANGCFWAMAQAAGKNSPEIATMRSEGVIDVLAKVMDHHAWNQTLVGRVRVTIPFIKDN